MLLLVLTAEAIVPCLLGPAPVEPELGAVNGAFALLFSMCVRMSLVYLSLLVISALLDSNARFSGIVYLSPFLLT